MRPASRPFRVHIGDAVLDVAHAGASLREQQVLADGVEVAVLAHEVRTRLVAPDPGGGVAVLRGHAVDEQVGRFEPVVVGGDDAGAGGRLPVEVGNLAVDRPGDGGNGGRGHGALRRRKLGGRIFLG